MQWQTLFCSSEGIADCTTVHVGEWALRHIAFYYKGWWSKGSGTRINLFPLFSHADVTFYLYNTLLSLLLFVVRDPVLHPGGGRLEAEDVLREPQEQVPVSGLPGERMLCVLCLLHAFRSLTCLHTPEISSLTDFGRWREGNLLSPFLLKAIIPLRE